MSPLYDAMIRHVSPHSSQVGWLQIAILATPFKRHFTILDLQRNCLGISVRRKRATIIEERDTCIGKVKQVIGLVENGQEAGQ